MLFLCDVYDAWLSKNKLPHRCASEILYGADTMANSQLINHTG